MTVDATASKSDGSATSTSSPSQTVSVVCVEYCLKSFNYKVNIFKFR